jgi:hypothetical protein
LANHFQLYPGTLGDNDCYLQLIGEYTRDHIDSWVLKDLIYEYGNLAVDELLNEMFISKVRDGRVQLSFKVEYTVTWFILDYVSQEVRTFMELLHMLGDSSTSTRLKNCLIYLENFGTIQRLELNGSGLTCIAAVETAEELSHDTWCKVGAMVNRSLMWSDHLDTRYLHTMNVEDGCKELNELIRSRKLI